MEATLNFGLYKGIPIEEIPMDYLIWIFPKLKSSRGTYKVVRTIISYFLTKKIRIENHTEAIPDFRFYFDEYENLDIDDIEQPFMTSIWRMENSKGEFVYEISNQNYPVFIEERDGLLNISEKYVSHTYKFGGLTLVFETNPEYYFFDAYGKIFKHAFLMRKPYIPEEAFGAEKFSENLLMKDIEDN